MSIYIHIIIKIKKWWQIEQIFCYGFILRIIIYFFIIIYEIFIFVSDCILMRGYHNKMFILCKLDIWSSMNCTLRWNCLLRQFVFNLSCMIISHHEMSRNNSYKNLDDANVNLGRLHHTLALIFFIFSHLSILTLKTSILTLKASILTLKLSIST